MKTGIIKMFKKTPLLRSFIRGKTWQHIRHGISLRIDHRENATFTGFLRLPTQFEALIGPVLDFILKGDEGRTVRISVYGCSNGAEAYTAASVLLNARPGLDFSIQAYDIDQEMITKARSAKYLHDEVFNNKRLTNEFIRNTFDRDGETFTLKPRIAKHVRFSVADVLKMDEPGCPASCDIAFAQNFLLHLKRDDSARALENIIATLGPKAALFIDGTDIDIRTKVTRRRRLTPLDFEIERIHNEARWARAIGWPYIYWGLEPFNGKKSSWRRRYSTIFLNNERCRGKT